MLTAHDRTLLLSVKRDPMVRAAVVPDDESARCARRAFTPEMGSRRTDAS